MSMKDNQPKLYTPQPNQRTFIPQAQRMQTVQTVQAQQQGPMNAFQRPQRPQYVAPSMPPQGPVHHQRGMAPVSIPSYSVSMIQQHQPPQANQVFYAVPQQQLPGVPPTQQFDPSSQYRPTFVYYPKHPSGVSPMAQQINYQTSMPQQVPQTMSMSMQPQMQPQQMPNTVVSMQQQQVQQPARQERPARKGITIKDPNSGKDVTDKILKRKTTKEPAPEQTWTPPPQQQQVPTPVAVLPEASAQDKIKAEFAAKVAARKDATETGPKDVLEESNPKSAESHLVTNQSHVVPKENGQVQLNVVETASMPVIAAEANIAEVPAVVEKTVESSLPQPKVEVPVESNAITDVLDKSIKPSEKDLTSPEMIPVVESAQAASETSDSREEIKTQDEPAAPEVKEMPQSTDVAPPTNEELTGKTTKEAMNDSGLVADIAVKTPGVGIAAKAEEIVTLDKKLTDDHVVDTTESNVQNTVAPVDTPVENAAVVAEKMLTDVRPEESIAEEPVTVENIAENETLPNSTEEELKSDDNVSIEKKEDAAKSSTKEIISDAVNPIVNGFEKPTPSSTVAQVPRKKKKGLKYKDKDTDLMSAFTDKPEEEKKEPAVRPEEVEETETKEEPVVEEETWENKEIKPEDGLQKDKRIIYDREFLLGFQFSKEKPKDLPDIEPVLMDPHEPTKPLEKGMRMQSGGFDFMPSFIRQGSGGRQIGTSRSGKGGRNAPPPKKIIPTSFETKVELKKAENAWVRHPEKQGDIDEETKITTDLVRKSQGILNKLTPQNFDKLVEQMKELSLNTVDRLIKVIDIIFEKALLEPGFSKAYAKLCDVLAKQKLVIESGKEKNVTFKRVLLNKCQYEFEKEKTDEQELEKDQNKHFENDEEEKRWQEEVVLKKHLNKKRSLGNIRFIGELFKLKMLTETIMHTCVTKLLKDRDEESLECLCQLLTTIGKDLDHEKAKPRTDQYFAQIDKIISHRKVSSRIIFMLQDVKELRETKWVSRRVADAPKKIHEIHEEARVEEMQMALAHQQAAQKRTMNKGGGRESPASGRGNTNDEGWNQVQSKNSRSVPQPVDPSRLKLSRRTDSENISLGPGGRPGAWAQGASGGGSSRFGPPADGESRQGNRFSALSGNEASSHRGDGKGRPGSRSSQQPARFGGRPAGPASSRRTNQSQNDEKAAALANVRRMLSGEGARTPSPPNVQKPLEEQEKQPVIESNGPGTPEPEAVQAAPVLKISETKLKHETKLTVEEFAQTQDFKEAESCIRDLNCASLHHIVVSEAINIAVERKLDQVKSTGVLLHGFIKCGLISLASFKRGLSEVLEFAEDIAVDIPHIWTNLGVILGPAVNAEALPLCDLKTLVEPLIPGNKAGLLMAETLAAASRISNEDDVGTLWKRSGLSWENLLREGSDLASFISKTKMEFTNKQDARPGPEDLRKILGEQSCTCDFAIDWIEKQIPSSQRSDANFIRELSTAVYSRAVSDGASEFKFDPSQIKKFKNLLMKYIDSDKNKELQALFAAQLLAEDLKHPKDFLRPLFEVLYDEEIISEDSVEAWEKNDEVSVGKGSALTSVDGFLKWLKTSEEESPDESK